MKIPPLYLTYVFSQKEFENNFLHKIEISSYFEEKPFLNKEDLIKILELDNAYFYKNSVRFFNEEVNGFLKMPENFHLEIDENDPQVNLVILLKMRIQTITQTRFNSLQDEMKKLRSEMEQMRGELFLIILQKFHFFFYRNYRVHGQSTKHSASGIDIWERWSKQQQQPS